MNKVTAQACVLIGLAVFLLALSCLAFGFLDVRYHRIVVKNIAALDAADTEHIRSHEKSIQLVRDEMVKGSFALVFSIILIGIGYNSKKIINPIELCTTNNKNIKKTKRNIACPGRQARDFLNAIGKEKVNERG